MDNSKLLPPFPIPFGRSHHRDVYSAVEMHEYARAAIAAASKWPATSINTEEFRKLVTAYMKYADSPDMTSGHCAWSQLINHIDAKMKALNIAATPAADHQEMTDEQINEVWEAMPGGPDAWLRNFGYNQFARAVLAASQPPPAAEQDIDLEAIAWAYQKLLAYGVGNTNMDNAMMMDRLNLMLLGDVA